MKTPLIITVGDYHEFSTYVDNFKANNINVEYEEVGYGYPLLPNKKFEKANPSFRGYVAVFWEKGKKNNQVKKTIRESKEYLENEDI